MDRVYSWLAEAATRTDCNSDRKAQRLQTHAAAQGRWQRARFHCSAAKPQTQKKRAAGPRRNDAFLIDRKRMIDFVFLKFT
jgi:hypothetical protein